MQAIRISLLLLLATGAYAEQFEFSPASVRARVWGGDWGRPVRQHFQEVLPAIAERTLVLDRFETGGDALEWIFTGEHGGVTLRLRESEAVLEQRFYDSYGLNEFPDGKVKPARHPERVPIRTAVPLERPPREVTVLFDHRLGVELRIDGKQVARQDCLLDVRRHQLAYLGKKGPRGVVRGRMTAPEAATAAVRIDRSTRHQRMLGFGGIATPTAYAELSEEGKRRWWEIVAEYNLLLHREYPIGVRLNERMDNWDRLEDATPHYYGDNFPNGEISDFEYMQQVRRLGGKVLFEFWALPAWARQDWKDAQGKLHAGVAEPKAYARAMVRYCQVHRERTGQAPEIVGIQNEVRQPPEIWREMAIELRRALDRAASAQPGFTRGTRVGWSRVSATRGPFAASPMPGGWWTTPRRTCTTTRTTSTIPMPMIRCCASGASSPATSRFSPPNCR
ncbi:MAG: hypothetical protein GY953_27415 [bacterium]|nr:hypothetical protein [bacterium]